MLIFYHKFFCRPAVFLRSFATCNQHFWFLPQAWETATAESSRLTRLEKTGSAFWTSPHSTRNGAGSEKSSSYKIQGSRRKTGQGRFRWQARHVPLLRHGRHHCRSAGDGGKFASTRRRRSSGSLIKSKEAVWRDYYSNKR